MNVNFERCVRISELHAQGLDDHQISAAAGIGRTTVQRLRNGMGLPPQPKRPPAPKPKREYVTSGRHTGGGSFSLDRQMDRFLAAVALSNAALPEDSSRAKEAGRLGRMPAPPVTATASSSLERC